MSSTKTVERMLVLCGLVSVVRPLSLLGGSDLWKALEGVEGADFPGAKSQPFKIEPCSLSSDKYVW